MHAGWSTHAAAEFLCIRIKESGCVYWSRLEWAGRLDLCQARQQSTHFVAQRIPELRQMCPHGGAEFWNYIITHLYFGTLILWPQQSSNHDALWSMSSLEMKSPMCQQRVDNLSRGSFPNAHISSRACNPFLCLMCDAFAFCCCLLLDGCDVCKWCMSCCLPLVLTWVVDSLQNWLRVWVWVQYQYIYICIENAYIHITGSARIMSGYRPASSATSFV